MAECPCAGCAGQTAINSHGDLECPKCGYCQDERDAQIANCGMCLGFSFIINDSEIICSNCGLEMSVAGKPEYLIAAWNFFAEKR